MSEQKSSFIYKPQVPTIQISTVEREREREDTSQCEKY